MKERMQKTSAFANDCLQRDRSETEWYGGVQTFMWMTEDNIVEVPFDREHLLEVILSPDNMNKAYKAVVRNKGKGGIDKMSCEQLLPWLLANKDELIRSLLDGTYRPNPVRRVEIPKGNGKMRLLAYALPHKNEANTQCFSLSADSLPPHQHPATTLAYSTTIIFFLSYFRIFFMTFLAYGLISFAQVTFPFGSLQISYNMLFCFPYFFA